MLLRQKKNIGDTQSVKILAWVNWQTQTGFYRFTANNSLVSSGIKRLAFVKDICRVFNSFIRGAYQNFCLNPCDLAASKNFFKEMPIQILGH